MPSLCVSVECYQLHDFRAVKAEGGKRNILILHLSVGYKTKIKSIRFFDFIRDFFFFLLHLS